jgi:hypothetical protein
VLKVGEVSIPERWQWFCVNQKQWRLDSIPTRGEYLLKPGDGTSLRARAAVLQLEAPFFMEISK